MKKSIFITILMLLPMLASAESIYGEWRLVGWNDGGIRFEVDTNYVSHKHMSIEIPKEGYVKAYSMVNEIFLGLLTLNGNEMVFGGEKRWLSTEVYCDIKENLFFENHICDIKLYHFDGNMLKLYYTDTDYFIFTSFINNSEDMQAQEESNDYIPFVQNDKVWHVVRSAFNEGYHFEQYMLSGEEVVKDDKTYMKMYRSENNLTAIYDAALLREENRKVYIFDTDRQKEFLMFDYSLKAGDTYETYSYDEQKMVTYKVLSVNDFTEGPEVIRYDNDNTPHRYLRKWMVCRTDDNSNQKTWIEGVGSLEYPLANLYEERPISSRRNLAYVEYYDVFSYLPFSFHNELGQIYGCNLPTGEADHSDDWHDQLTYELEGDRLHVYGKVLTQCGPFNYIYFYERETDDPLVHKIEIIIYGVDPIATCMSLHATDFYVPGFDPNMNYIVVMRGEEYPVINMAYYYYYQGKKIPLTLNENKVVVSIPKDCGEITERFRANVQTLFMINDEAFDIYVIPQSEYEKLTTLDFWEKDAKSIVLTSSYFTESNEEVFATPYLNVRLKKEEDIDLLTSYAEQYKLTIVGNSPLMPLWYILSVTPESGKSPLECANELYESGNFASSVPDLTDAIMPQPTYHPFIEEGKVWKVGHGSRNPIQFVEYYYFDGDTIIDGKTCKQMMCQRYVNAEHPDYAIISQLPSLSYVGAWYEENKKVYFCYATNNQFTLMYDFSVDDNATLQIHGQSYVIGPKQTGGIKGFKGTYRDVMMLWDEEQNPYNTTWLEGVGGIEGPIYNVYLGEEYHGGAFLMSCTVGDEVIYLNDEYEDGATPEDMGAKKHRFDFTHTVKTQPRMPTKRVEEAQSLYGEYSNLRLGINLDPLDAVYQVRITNESGKVVYEKAINAGNIVALDIDISTYAEGRYTVTVENSHETFSGEFEMQTTGIEEVRNEQEVVRGSIYNLQGQRISTLQKGLNIVNGRKVYVK